MHWRQHRAATSRPPLDGMVWIPSCESWMSGNQIRAEEMPARRVPPRGLWVDCSPVTVLGFSRFVEATGYVTVAEQRPDPALYPDTNPALLVPGSLVVQYATGLSQRCRTYIPGVSWHAPDGVFSNRRQQGGRPVTHVAYQDALAYAAWAGKALPTESEWEYAIFGSHGLFSAAGNLWEWTCDAILPGNIGGDTRPGCAQSSPAFRLAPGPSEIIPWLVIKSASRLWNPDGRPNRHAAARRAQAADTSTSDLGFRCVVRPA